MNCSVKILFSVLMFLGIALSGAEKYSDAEYQAAYDFFEAADFRRIMDDTLVRGLEKRKNLPNMDVLYPVLLNFYRKYCSYDAAKKQLAEIYLKHFSVQELRELTAFYKSPVGKKMSKKQVLVNDEVYQMGQKTAKDHLPELQKDIKKQLAPRMPKNQKTKGLKGPKVRIVK